MAADQDAGEHRLAGGIPADDGEVLAVEGFKIDGTGHAPQGHTCHALLYFDGGLHIRSWFLLT